ncbi:MAG: hypothetical protein QOK10_3800, partial [Pseudonocardiales bacterium]|nr:hypothetical protein [Pseudonocardiales bacterium]
WFAADVSDAFERSYGLGGCLLADAQPAPELGRGAAVGSDRLKSKPVKRAGFTVAAVGQRTMKLIDHGPECAD